ncbi:MAG: DUF2807 domain-containing protein [Micropepsaceae bacterium]
MNLISKLGLTAVLAGAGVTVSALAMQGSSYSPVSQNYLLAPLASLASVVGATASATPVAPAGPFDRQFTAKRVHLDKVVGQIELIVAPAGAMHVQAWGKPDTMKELQVRIVGEELYVRLDRHDEEAWFPWNLFNMWSAERRPADLTLRIAAPSGTPYEMEDISGNIAAGDLDAPVSLDGHSLSGRFGRVQNAKVSLAGSGKVTFGPIRDQLDVDIAGSGHVEAPSAAAAQVEIAGGGEVILGAIAQGLDIEIAGSGDVKAVSINGPLDVEIAGSGDVVVDGGTATSFKVEIAGSGDVTFKGHAVNPHIEIMGSGSVVLGSYTGELDKDIAGSGDVKVLGTAPLPAPAGPPAPPAH